LHLYPFSLPTDIPDLSPSLPDALPISTCEDRDPLRLPTVPESLQGFVIGLPKEYFPPELDPAVRRACDRAIRIMKELGAAVREVDRKSTRLNSSHEWISYAVFCLKKKT